MLLLIYTGVIGLLIAIFCLLIRNNNKSHPVRSNNNSSHKYNLSQYLNSLMGVFLDKPKMEKECFSGSIANGVLYGTASMQGWRLEMEDSTSIIPDLSKFDPKLKDWSFFSVFDGHAGSTASQYSCEHLAGYIINSQLFKDSFNHNNNNNNNNDINNNHIDATSKDSDDSNGVTYNCDMLSNAITQGFINLDTDLRQELNRLSQNNKQDRSGTTVACVLITHKHFFIANCGDSRTILGRSAELNFHSEDHKPYNTKERERIEAGGGAVLMQRVNGSLAVSRALGDFDYKAIHKPPNEQLVSPIPDVSCIERSLQDELLVLACDGVWDVLSNEEVLRFISNRLKVVSDIKKIAGDLLYTSLYKNSRDNMSVVILSFPSAPVTTQEFIEEDKLMAEEVKPLMESKIEEHINICKTNKSDPQIHVVMQELAYNIDPRYQVALRQSYVEEQLKKLMSNHHTPHSNSISSQHIADINNNNINNDNNNNAQVNSSSLLDSQIKIPLAAEQNHI